LVVVPSSHVPRQQRRDRVAPKAITAGVESSCAARTVTLSAG
jgi:hypothetical protein